jgi:hypothetical protein
LLAQSTTDGDRRVERRKSLPILCLEKHDDYVGTLQSVSLGQTTRQSSDWRDSKNDYITVGNGAENTKEKSRYVFGGKSKGSFQKLN